MQELIYILFISEFLLFLSFFLISLKTQGLSFKLGICFGVLYFLFIPIIMMLTTGVLRLPIVDFGRTSLGDVVLRENIKSSWMLILFLAGILIYLFSPELSTRRLRKAAFPETMPGSKWQVPFVLYSVLTLYILLESGILEGGNWYNNRHDFMSEGGSLAVLMVFGLNASRALLIIVLYEKWQKHNEHFFLAALIAFVLIDMLLSGNRVYAFITGSMILLNYFKNYPVTVLKYSAISLPILFGLGYFGSIYRHMRGPLFEQGIPGFDRFREVLVYAINHEPPDLYDFLSGISESVNVNVIYGLFNRFEDFLHGTTYLKTLLFPIPRSVWPDKPLPITNIAGAFFDSVSLVTTFIGEMFMNFGYWGIALLPLFLVLTEFGLKHLFCAYRNYFDIILFFAGLMIFRMPFSDTVLVFVIVHVMLRLSAASWKFTYLPSKNKESIP